MLSQGIVLAFLTLIFSSAQANIVKARNGTYVAHAIVCKNADASIKSAELLDIFEARTKYELAIVEQGPTMDANLSVVQKKLITIFKDAGLKNLPSTYIDDIVASLSLDTKDISTLPTNITTTTPTPQGCELLPVAFYENATDLIVYSELWNKMDGLNKAGVIAHLAIYRHESELGDANVDRIRKIVGYLFSDTKLNSLNQDVPADANVCSAFDRYDATRVFFEFFKYDDPKNELQEILQFTKFRGVHPYGLTRVTTPKWAWPKQEGDLFLEVDSPIEQFSELYIRREWKTTGVLDNYFFDEVNGDFQVRCAKSTDADLAILKIIFTSNFEPIAVGGARMLTFEISNVGKGKSVAMIASGLNTPFGFLGGKYPGTGGTCASSLQAGATCTLNIVFAPTVAGKSTDTLVIDFNDGATKQQISIGIEGTSLSPAELTISGGAAVVHNFGTNAMGVIKDQLFTITNSGGVRATNMQGLGLASPFVFRGGSYPGTGGTCTANLEPKGTCTVAVSYVPIQVGTHKDTMQLSYASGAVTQTLSKDLLGVAVKPALLTISESDPYDFGVVATGAIKTITLTVANIGEHGASNIYGLGLSAPFAFAGGFSYPGKGGTCGFNIGVGAKCTFILQFVPTGSGNAADTVELQYNNGATSKVSQRSLAGVGATPALLIISDGPDYNFGFAYPGTSLDHTFTVTNTGATAATKVESLSLKAPFVLEGGFPGKGGTCGQSLGAGASCTFVVTFAPDKVASYKDALNLSYQNGVDVKKATRELSGLAGQAAELVMTTGTIYSFGDTDLGMSKEIELVIVNTGGSPAIQLQDGGGLTEPYSYKGGSYPGVGGTCTSELAPNELCTVVVTYIPQKTGMHKETLALSYFNGHSKQYVLQYFEGTGISQKSESWSPWNFFALSEK